VWPTNTGKREIRNFISFAFLALNKHFLRPRISRHGFRRLSLEGAWLFPLPKCFFSAQNSDSQFQFQNVIGLFTFSLANQGAVCVNTKSAVGVARV